MSLFTLGCASKFNYTAVDAPQATSLQSDSPKSAPRVAVVLGSGGPRGYAHIGVMRVLEDAGIKPDLIVGSSVGSLLGAFWASGLSAKEIDNLSMSGGPLTLFDPSLLADRGWIHGQRLQNYVNDNLGQTRLQDLATPMVVVATDRATKQPVFFNRGNIGVAVRASSAMPGIFSPVGILGTEYEDGDESLPVAVQAAKRAGAKYVIAVDVSVYDGGTPPDASASEIARDKARRARINPETQQADFLIHPALNYRAGPFKSYFVHARATGEETAIRLLAELKADMQKKLGSQMASKLATTGGGL